MGNQNQMMRQAQAMQRKLAKAQEELAAAEVSGQAGGGMVKVTLSGTADEVRAVEIAADAVDPDDTEMLADMVAAATNEALRAAKELEQTKIGPIAGGLGLPGM